MNNKMTPRNIPINYCIKVVNDEDELPVGSVVAKIGFCTGGFLPCMGQRVFVEDYMELYAAIGDLFCPATITLPLTTCQRLLQFFGFSVQPKVIRNKDYTPNMFRLRDLQGDFNV